MILPSSLNQYCDTSRLKISFSFANTYEVVLRDGRFPVSRSCVRLEERGGGVPGRRRVRRRVRGGVGRGGGESRRRARHRRRNHEHLEHTRPIYPASDLTASSGRPNLCEHCGRVVAGLD